MQLQTVADGEEPVSIILCRRNLHIMHILPSFAKNAMRDNRATGGLAAPPPPCKRRPR
jgi:hypothetical protein